MTALYDYGNGTWAAYFLDAPEFLNRPFGQRFADGLPAGAVLTAKRRTPVGATTEQADAD